MTLTLCNGRQAAQQEHMWSPNTDDCHVTIKTTPCVGSELSNTHTHCTRHIEPKNNTSSPIHRCCYQAPCVLSLLHLCVHSTQSIHKYNHLQCALRSAFNSFRLKLHLNMDPSPRSMQRLAEGISHRYRLSSLSGGRCRISIFYPSSVLPVVWLIENGMTIAKTKH